MSSYPTQVSPQNPRKRQKVVEVLVERPVITQRYVDVDEEMIREVPVGRRVEQERIIERVVEVPKVVEKYVEVEKINYVNQDIIKEEYVYEKKIVDVPYEVIEERPYEVVKEELVKVPVYVDRHVERLNIKPIETRVVQNDVIEQIPIEIDFYQEDVKTVEVPVYYDQEFTTIVDVPVTREHQIPIEIDFFTEREVIEKIDQVIDVPYETVIEKEIIQDQYIDEPYEVVVPVKKEVKIQKENRMVMHEETRVPINIDVDIFEEVIN